MEKALLHQMVPIPLKTIWQVPKLRPPAVIAKLCAGVRTKKIQIKTYLKVSSPPPPRMVVAVDVDVIECCEARFLGDLLLDMRNRGW